MSEILFTILPISLETASTCSCVIFFATVLYVSAICSFVKNYISYTPLQNNTS